MAQLPKFNFTCGNFDDGLLPVKQVLVNSLRRVETHRLRSSLGYCGPKGADELRDALLKMILVERGMRCTRKTIAITCGALHTVTLLGLMLSKKFSQATVAVEMPGYFGFRKTLRMLGIRVLALPVDEEGAYPDVGVISQSHAVILTPRHHFPTNVTMSSARRATFRELAEQGKCLVVEDDYSCDFEFQATEIRPLSMGKLRRGLVYVGSFSKSLAPGLRLGYVVAEPRIVEDLSAIRWRIDRHSPELLQLVLAELIRSGEYKTAVERTMQSYKSRWLAMGTALEKHFGFTSQATGGLSFWLPAQTNWESIHAIASHSEHLGIRFTSGLDCYDTPPGFGALRLGYTCVSLDQIDIGVQNLAQCFRDVLGSVPKWKR
ncbi:PLP-dependent aminotransferase family protein [Candidatus Latescibacterota bacterium]